MQITLELDNQHIEKLHALENQLKMNASELLAYLIDELFEKYIANTNTQQSFNPFDKNEFFKHR